MVSNIAVGIWSNGASSREIIGAKRSLRKLACFRCISHFPSLIDDVTVFLGPMRNAVDDNDASDD